ncbi:hypothetical protein L1987_39282 [Smallanthus sonchifolius]|uniref:Uncharacterized protein n=1 Tax=Smallanthus sonchifolius TaxID=185202 RepID=A0ACB9HLD5_9ASTR|nr:hypothetical protein L1987_39282 [Smallanthus sonchifolius]
MIETRLDEKPRKANARPKDLVGSFDKRMANVEVSVTQLIILDDGSLEKLEALEILQADLEGLREDFKSAIELICLEMQTMFKGENARLKKNVDDEFQDSYKNVVERQSLEGKQNMNDATTLVCNCDQLLKISDQKL